MQYKTCPGCGSNLDHGERCADCRDNEKSAPTTAMVKGAHANVATDIIPNSALSCQAAYRAPVFIRKIEGSR